MHNADNLEDHDAVRIGGELAGQVLDPHVSHGVAVVQLQLSSKFQPLRSDSTIRIRLRSAVGVRFVQIYPGKYGKPIPNNGVLAASQSRSPVDLDQVLDTFSAPTRAGTRQFLGELGTGLMERGQTVNQTLAQAPAFISGMGSVLGAINARPDAMAHLITAADGTAAAFDPVRNNLADGFRPGAQALEPFVQQRPSVENTLVALPATLSTAQSDLPQVNDLLGQVDGLARAAVPTLAAAPGALHQTALLLATAKPGLSAANATLHYLGNAVDPAVSFLRTTQPELPRVNLAMADLLPTVKYVAPRSCALSTAFTGWSEVMKLGTAYDNFIRFTLTETQNLLANQGTALTSAYPGPCVNGADVVGAPLGTPEQQQQNPEGTYR
jgi:ABC-type transporter Mla subunit MlaD